MTSRYSWQSAREPSLLDVGHDHRRSSGVKQGGFDDQFLRPDHIGVGLTDNRQIEPAGEVAENVSGPGQARCLEPRFDRDPGPPRHLLEPGHGCVGSLLGERTLLGDKVHRQPTPHQGRWQHRFIGKRHSGKVRTESLGDRNRVLTAASCLASAERCNTISLIMAALRVWGRVTLGVRP